MTGIIYGSVIAFSNAEGFSLSHLKKFKGLDIEKRFAAREKKDLYILKHISL